MNDINNTTRAELVCLSLRYYSLDKKRYAKIRTTLLENLPNYELDGFEITTFYDKSVIATKDNECFFYISVSDREFIKKFKAGIQ